MLITTITADRLFNGDGSNCSIYNATSGTTATTILAQTVWYRYLLLLMVLTGTTLTFTEASSPGDVIDAPVLTTTSL